MVQLREQDIDRQQSGGVLDHAEHYVLKIEKYEKGWKQYYSEYFPRFQLKMTKEGIAIIDSGNSKRYEYRILNYYAVTRIYGGWNAQDFTVQVRLNGDTETVVLLIFMNLFERGI